MRDYAWDRLIQLFTANVIGGTSVEIAGFQPTASLAERALRKMALERRVSRRALGYAFTSALTQAEQLNRPRFARVILPFEGCADPETGYVFLILAFKDDWLINKGYDHYREGRAAFLKAYCQSALHEFRHLKRMVGIAVDASPHVTGRRGGSEDLMLLEINEWTPELERETQQLREDAEILITDQMKMGRLQTSELLNQHVNSVFSGNRKERRAKKAKDRNRTRP